MTMTLPAWRRLFRIGRNATADVDEEVDFHLRMRIEQFIGEGMPRDVAERAARERFGDVASTKSHLVNVDRAIARRLDWKERIFILQHDVRVALRSLRAEPLFASGVICTLA